MEYWKELSTYKKASHEAYDKALITLSGGGLVVSTTVIKDLFQLNKIIYSDLLVLSWILFAAAIIVIVVSFYTSVKAVDAQMNHLRSERGDEEFTSVYNAITGFLNLITGVIFIIAVICMVVFMVSNFENMRKQMSAQDELIRGSTVATRPLSEGLALPKTPVPPSY